MKKNRFLFLAVLFVALSLGFVSCENPDDEPGFSLENVGQDDANSDKENAEGSTDGDGTTPSTPEEPMLVATGGATDVEYSSVTLWGRLNTDTLVFFPKVKWGVEYSASKEEITTHSGKKKLCTADLVGENADEFVVELTEVGYGKMLYYNAYLLINDIKYVYGEVDSVHMDVKLTLKTNNSDYGTVEGSGYYEPNTEVAITAIPNSDYIEFVQWSDGNTENPRTVTVTSDVTYTATFKVTDRAFSVSSGKYVVFSSGNLQYTQSTNTWSFASAQWEIIGTDNVTGGSVSSDPKYGDSKEGTALADKVDLFGWSTGTTNFGVSTSKDYDDYSGSFVDWGRNQIGSDAPNTWRTLTNAEWEYLLETRTNASSLKGVAEVNGVNGLILLPDSWTCPDGITFKSGFHDDYGVEYYAAYQTFTADQWSKMETAGAVFLPAAGYRGGSDVGRVQYYGGYWSATENGSYDAYYLYFFSGGAYMDFDSRRYDGRSVRLVKDL